MQMVRHKNSSKELIFVVIMNLQYLNSISEIRPEDCFKTAGSNPVKVLCDDLNYYICKYFKGYGFANSLFNEYIAYSFLRLWKIKTPDFAIVNVKKEHLKQTELIYSNFDMPCFGSFYHGDFKEVDKFFITLQLLNKDNLSAMNSLLKIGIFDLWMSNEDRHFCNFNMLYDLKQNVFVPIDHVLCFNSNNLDKEPYLISENESILNPALLSKFFLRTLHQNRLDIRLAIIEEFTINVKKCHDELENILNATPVAWNSDSVYLEKRLSFLFSDEWISQCIDKFNYLFAINIK